MDVIRRELHWRKLSYSYQNKRVFYCCQWPWPRPVFLCIRIFLALYTVLQLTGIFEEIYTTYIYYSDIHGDWLGTIDQGTKEHNTTDLNITEQGTTEQNATEQGIIEQSNAKGNVYNVGAWSKMASFTQWTYILLTLHMVFAAVISIGFYKQSSPKVNNFEPSQTGVTKTSSENEMKLLGTQNPNYTGDVPQTVNPNTGETFVPSVDNKEERELTTSMENEMENENCAGRRASSSESDKHHHTVQMSLKTPIYFKILWCLSDINSVWAPIVTIFFFAVLFPKHARLGKDHTLNFLDHNRHTLNSVFVFVDHLVSPRPVRLLHFVAPVVFGVIYVIFSFVFWSIDRLNYVLYSPYLDWNYPLIATGFCLGLALVAIPLLQLLFFAFYQLKCLVYRKLYGSSFY